MNTAEVLDPPNATILAARHVRFVPLGISRVSDAEACVGAMSEDGTWVRPEIPTLAEVKSASSPFIYFQWANADLGQSEEADPRPEDHHMVRRATPEAMLPTDEWRSFLETHLDAGAEDAFAGLRSLGLIAARVSRIYRKRSTGGRTFLRMEFEDSKGELYDWIVSEVRLPELLEPWLVDGDIPPELNDRLNSAFQSSSVFLTLALTKANNRFPGKFRGCHPVIIGIHTVPDYTSIFADQKA